MALHPDFPESSYVVGEPQASGFELDFAGFEAHRPTTFAGRVETFRESQT